MTGSTDNRGYALIVLMVLVFSLTLISLEKVSTLIESSSKTKEEELIYTGLLYVSAIGSFYQSSPGSVKHFPKELEELIRDERFVRVERHLRRLYPDPMNVNVPWGVIRNSQGEIVGVYSQSDKATSSKVRYYQGGKVLVGDRYSDWRFTYELK